MHAYRPVRLALVAIITTALLATTGGSAANADGEDDDCIRDEYGACIDVPLPGDDDDEGGEEGGNGSAVCRDFDGSEVPCSKDGMPWFGDPHYCYAAPVSPPMDPPPGKKATDGQWWMCVLNDPGGALPWWVEDGNQPVDGEAVARQLMVSIPYELADAKIAPPPTYHTYISYENWLWIESAQWHTVSASRSLRGATVTLTATPSYVEWDMGNDDTVSCVGAGRAWVKGMSENAPTNCSYAYDSMEDPEGDTWTVTAQISYTLAWTCSGNCGGATGGDLGSQLAAAGDSTTITVYQRQTVNKNGG